MKQKYYITIEESACPLAGCAFEMSCGKTYGDGAGEARHFRSVTDCAAFLRRLGQQWRGGDSLLNRTCDPVTTCNLRTSCYNNNYTTERLLALLNDDTTSASLSPNITCSASRTTSTRVRI